MESIGKLMLLLVIRMRVETHVQPNQNVKLTNMLLMGFMLSVGNGLVLSMEI